ncbi:MAG: hypothetical protein GF417_08065 [Candidatus Latescibacteria bacterium]|nr:hypothetical protein [bacterium]MBD3424376.1 hypothetical protein [Candidatus Latescibacterota bacterium]
MDIALLYKGKGMLDRFEKYGTEALKMLLMNGRNSEAAQWAVEMISEDTCSEKGSKLLIRAANNTARSGDHQTAFDIFNYIRKNSPSAAISLKASISLARLLAKSMGNPDHALLVLDEAKRQDIDPRWQESIAEVESGIRRSSAPKLEGEIPTL